MFIGFDKNSQDDRFKIQNKEAVLSKHKSQTRNGGMGYRRRNRRGRSRRKKVFFNRRNPNSGWVCFGDIFANIRQIFYCWEHRVPRGSELHWKGGKIVGHTTRSR